MRRNQRVLVVLVAGLTVLTLAGCSNSKSKTTSSGGQSAGGGVTVTTAAASAGPAAVNVVGGEKPDGKYYLTATPGSAKAGPTTITFTNVGKKVHEVIILKTDTPAGQLKVGADHKISEDASVGEDSETDAGKTKSTTINLKPGSYVFVCNIARHYEKGMYAAFTVS